MKTEIKTLHLENDNNKMPRLIMTDEHGVEWVLSHQSMSYEGAGMAVIEKKAESFYFNKKNVATQ